MTHCIASPRLVFGCSALIAAVVGCAAPSDDAPHSSASFSVVGTWSGTARDDDTELPVTLELDNDGGNSTGLGGVLDIEGIGPLAFEGGFIDIGAGASRVASIDAQDDDGYLYTLRGTFTSKRLDDGQLESSNPALDIDIVYLAVTLTHAP